MTARPSLSLLNGIRCLQHLAAAPEAIGSRDLARALALEHTKVNRLLGTLAEVGLAARTPERKYRPGPAIHLLAAQSLIGSQLLHLAVPWLKRLHRDGRSVALAVRWEQRICYLVHARPGVDLDEAIGQRPPHPINASSLGLVLDALDGRPGVLRPERLPAAVALPCAALAAGRSAIRAAGLAQGRFADGTVSVAAAIGDPVEAAIGVSRPGLDTVGVAALASELAEAAAALSAASA